MHRKRITGSLSLPPSLSLSLSLSPSLYFYYKAKLSGAKKAIDLYLDPTDMIRNGRSGYKTI